MLLRTPRRRFCFVGRFCSTRQLAPSLHGFCRRYLNKRPVNGRETFPLLHHSPLFHNLSLQSILFNLELHYSRETTSLQCISFCQQVPVLFLEGGQGCDKLCALQACTMSTYEHAALHCGGKYYTSQYKRENGKAVTLAICTILYNTRFVT